MANSIRLAFVTTKKPSIPTTKSHSPSLPHCPGEIHPCPVNRMVAHIPMLAGLKKCLPCALKINLDAIVINAAKAIMMYWSHRKSKHKLSEEMNALLREVMGSLRKMIPKVWTIKAIKNVYKKILSFGHFKVALKTTKNISKHHPSNFQKKVILSLNAKLEEVQSKYNVVECVACLTRLYTSKTTIAVQCPKCSFVFPATSITSSTNTTFVHSLTATNNDNDGSNSNLNARTASSYHPRIQRRLSLT